MRHAAEEVQEDLCPVEAMARKIPPQNGQTYLVWDLDGTLVDSKHREHHITPTPGVTFEHEGNAYKLVKQLGTNHYADADPWNAIHVLSGVEVTLTPEVFAKSFPRDWRAWEQDIPGDTPIAQNLWLLKALRPTILKEGKAVMFLTARSEHARELTRAYIEQLGVFFPELGDLLVLRPKDDYRKDADVKCDWITAYRSKGAEFLMAFDDRANIAKAFRGIGLYTLHVAN